MRNAKSGSGVRWLCAWSVVCAACVGANARANDIRIFFGQPECPGTCTTAFVPESHWGESALPGSYTLGVWAEVQCDMSDPSDPVMDVWNGIDATFAFTGGPVTVSDAAMDNFDHWIGPGTAYRWEQADIDPGPEDPIFLVSLPPTYGLGGLYPREFGYGNGSTDWWSYTVGTPGTPDARYRYWLGNLTLSYAGTTPANVYFCIGMGGIARMGGDVEVDRIYFGEDDPVGLRGDAFGEHGSLPDFVFTPEPGSLVLLALAACTVMSRRSARPARRAGARGEEPCIAGT